MSLDLYMVIKSCEHCGQSQTTDSLNMTYNLWPMWAEIFPGAEQMCDIDDMSGDEAEPYLKIALRRLNKNSEKFKAFNPANGWGTYEDFVKYIENLIKLCKEYPDGIWKSDR